MQLGFLCPDPAAECLPHIMQPVAWLQEWIGLEDRGLASLEDAELILPGAAARVILGNVGLCILRAWHAICLLDCQVLQQHVCKVLETVYHVQHCRAEL